MIEIKVTIEGISPLLMHRFNDAAQMEATESTRTSAVGDRGTPREQAESVLYTDERGVVGLPQPVIFSNIIEGGKFFKAGKSKVTTLKTSMIPSCVFLRGVFYTITPQDWEVDIRPVRIPSTGGRILRYRPRLDKWRLSYQLELDESILAPKLLREIVDAAGSRIGLCDFRPACKGPFGRFVVTEWDEASLGSGR